MQQSYALDNLFSRNPIVSQILCAFFGGGGVYKWTEHLVSSLSKQDDGYINYMGEIFRLGLKYYERLNPTDEI